MKRSGIPLRRRWKRWSNLVRRAMTLGLIISCGGCASMDSQLPMPSVGSGNALLGTLPAGTLLTLPKMEESRQLCRLFINEASTPESEPCTLRLEQPLNVATPEYLLQRDAAEAAALLVLLKYRQRESDR